MDVASSAKRLSKLPVTEDRLKPVSSTVARARNSAIATADAPADARHEASIRRACVTHGLKDLARISALPFPASVNKAAGGQQLTRSVEVAMSEIVMCSEYRCTEGLRSPTWVPGWDPPVHKSFMRAITPDKPLAADMTTLIDKCFGQLSRALKEGASSPEAFTLLLRRLMTLFDRVGTERVTPSCTILGCAPGRPFAISVESFAY